MAKRIAGRIIRALWLVAALLVIVYALLVVAAREMLPLIDRYQADINGYLSDTFGADVHIDRLTGLWQGVTPKVTLENVRVADSAGAAIAIDKINAELQLGQTLANGTAVWRALSVDHLRIQLLEDEQGNWTLAGKPLASGGAGGQFGYLKRMFFQSRLLEIDTFELDMHFYSGATAKIVARDLRVENSEGFHRTTARLATDASREDMATFVFEGRDNPPDSPLGSGFVGHGYLRLNHLNMVGSLGTIAKAWVPEKFANIKRANLDTELWFDWRDGALVNARGKMAALEIPLGQGVDAAVIRNLRAELTGWFTPGEDWGVRVQGLAAQWQGRDIAPINAHFRQRVGKRWGELDVAVSQLDVGILNGLLQQGKLLGDEPSQLLAELNPKGVLKNLAVDVNFSGDRPDFQLRANLDEMAVDAWQGAPAARGITGYVQANLHQGFVALDSTANLAMHFRHVYDNFMPFGHTRGKVAWQWLPEEHRVLVTSNRISIEGEEGQGAAFLHLDLPTRMGGDPQMYLLVGMKNSHARYVERYLPKKVLNPDLLAWLDGAVVDGNIEEAGFIYRGSLLKRNNDGRSIQVYAKVNNGVLDYQQGWPALDNLSTQLVVDNTRLDAWVTAGTAGGGTLQAGGVTLRMVNNKPLLRVSADVQAPVADAVAVLLASPVGENLRALAPLNASGAAKIALDLRIPLTKNQKSGHYGVSTTLKHGALDIPATGLRVVDVSGTLQFDLENGLRGQDLSGKLLDGAVTGDITSDSEGMHLAAKASPKAEALQAYLSTFLGALAQRFQGQADISANLLVPFGDKAKGDIKLVLDSSLAGLGVDLPAPFAKAAADGIATQVTLAFEGDRVDMTGGSGDKVAFAIKFIDNAFERGEIHLLSNRAALPEQKGLYVRGSLDNFIWSDWQPIISESGSGALAEGGLTALSPALELHLGQATFADFELGATQVLGSLTEAGRWQLALTTPRLAGNILLPGNNGQVLGIDLDYLRLPPGEAKSEADDNPVPAEPGQAKFPELAHLLPTDFPELDFAVANLYRGDNRLGNVALKVRKIPDGILVRDLEGEVRGIDIHPQARSNGAADEAEPNQLRWTYSDGIHSSFFSGALAMDNVADTLTTWDIPAPLNSKSAIVFAEMGWRAQPWEISLLALDGYLGLELHDGQFYRTKASATNTLLKLVGLINFDTWLRRLRFDFSDFFSGGVSFDKVQGGLLFREGLMDFDDPLSVSMPSGKIRLLGTADLIYEQLDARLVATMPVGTNLPWVAGLLGGLPAAAGVYLTSKIFAKQVDRLSSISYRVKGSFDDPDIEVDNIFSDPTELTHDKASNLETEAEAK